MINNIDNIHKTSAFLDRYFGIKLSNQTEKFRNESYHFNFYAAF